MERIYKRHLSKTSLKKMIDANYWNHQRKLSDAWYTAETGIEPLDDAIKRRTRVWVYSSHK